MPESPFRALVLLELRRVEPQLRRTAALAAGVALLISLLGWATPARLAFVLVVLGMAGLMPAVLNVLKDKLDGGLEFLVSLPVAPGTLATARLTAGVILAVVAGLCMTVATWIAARPNLPGTSAFAVALGLFAVVTGATTLFACLGIGMCLRMRASHFSNLAFAGILATFALEQVAGRLGPGGKAEMLRLVTSPWFPRVAAFVAVLVVASLGWLAYRLARTGLEGFTPERDKPTA